MRTALEITGFGLVSAALLVSAFGLSLPERAAGHGAGGTELESFEAAAEGVAAMVEDWETPPETAEEVALAAPPEMPAPLPVAPPGAAPDPLPEAPDAQAMLLPDLPDLTDLGAAEVPAAPAAPLPEVPSETLAMIAPAVAPPMPDSPETPEAADPAPDLARMTPPPAPDIVPPEVEAAPETPAPPPPAINPPPRAEPAARPAAPAKRGNAPVNSDRVRAVGSGGAVAGRDGRAAAANAATGADALAGWGAAIRSRIERQKRYPASARGAKGVVAVVISVGTDGGLRSASVARSSGVAALDAAALSAVRNARFPVAPATVAAGSHRFSLSVRFQ